MKQQSRASSFKDAFAQRKPTAKGSPQSPEATSPEEQTMTQSSNEIVDEVKEPEVVVPSVFSNLMAEAEADVAEQTAAATEATKGATPTELAMLEIARSMKAMMDRQEAVRQIPFNEMKPVTPFNPKGDRFRKEFNRPTWLQDILLNPLTHSEEEMVLFNQLKPGRYIDRKVEVMRGADGGINLRWNGKAMDKRIEFYSQWPDIKLLLRAILKEREDKLAKKRANVVDENEDLD